MLKQLKKCIAMLGALVMLSGCMSQSVEDFYVLPQLPEDYLALQETIDEILNTLGAEFAAPSSGSNVQTIQLQDLDGDGVQESAVAFFRVPNAEKPLKIYVFRQNEETQEYETAWIVEGEGTAIYSVAFENLGSGEEKELVVSWQISSKVHALAAYSLQAGGDVIELMRSGYTMNSVVDLDRDNQKEIVIVQLDSSGNSGRAELYDYDNGLMVLTSSVSLSAGITEIEAVKVGFLADYVPALFISSNFVDATGQQGRLTDIIRAQEGSLVNITRNSDTAMSTSTIRYYNDFQDANGTDINNDGMMELPIAEPAVPVTADASTLYLLNWNQYDANGTPSRVYTTYHNYEDGWYLILRESWLGEVTVARRDVGASNATTERAVSFYHLSPNGGQPEEFLTIYRLSGANRGLRAQIDGRFVIFESSDVIYAAKFTDTKWDCGLDEDGLRENFNRIRVDWSADSGI